ncbi:ABC transporter permease [Petropleomorpha daqingensis]|uniref:ABC-type transport system involved in multi-copper enzyme maturation permease subunit n=1 Tax=Petropleomorpha daqingensis TaxID=2026353 RepID=A0A853CJ75_9ACTN|nr:ABC-type transport system involved in multi-copper enzyme maturation permease subunit [Petropleomorpha daqingensis]
MNALVASTRAELLRLRRWPALWVLLGVWVTLNLSFGYVFDYIAYRTGDAAGPSTTGRSQAELLAGLLPSAAPVTLTQGMPMFGGALVMIMGALAVGSGYGWGTWKTVFTQGPSRAAAFGGTLAALASFVVGLVLVSAVVDLGVSCGIAAIEGQAIDLPSAGDWLSALGTGLLVLGMWAAAGVLVGVLTRSPALGVGLGLVWALVVENLLRGVSGVLDPIAAVTDHLPGTAAGSLVGALSTAESGTGAGTPGVFDTLSGTAAIGWLAVYLAGFVVLALALVRRRDVA